MNLKNIFIHYLKKRKESILYCGMAELGTRLSIKIDDMGRAKLLKPSEYEIDDMINTCKDMKEHLLILLEELNNNNIITVSEDEINKIKSVSITKLYDCKLIANSYRKIGCNLRSNYVNPLMSSIGFGAPIQFTITEMLITLALFFMGAWIFSILH